MTPEEAYQQILRERQEREGQSLNGVQGIPNDLVRPGGPIDPAPYNPIDPAQRYLPDLNTTTNPPGRQMADHAQPMDEARVGALAGWADSSEHGGLGIAGRGPLSAPTQDMGLADRYAREAFPDLHGELGFWDRARVNEAMMHGGLTNLATARQSKAQQMAALEETKRQNQWEDVFKVLGNEKLSPPQQVTMLKKLGETNPQAARAAMTVNDRMLGRFQANKDYLPRSPDEYRQGLQDGTLDWEAVSADIDAGEEIGKLVRKENASTAALQKLERMAQERPHDHAVQMALQSKRAELQKKILDQEIHVATAPAQKAQPDATLRKTNQDIARGTAPVVSSGWINAAGETVHAITDPLTGQRRESAGVPASTSTQKVQQMSSPAIEATVDSRTMLDQLDQLKKAYQADYVGPIDNLWAGLKEHAPGVFGPIGQKEGEFRKKVNQVLLTAKKLNIGTAQSAAETESFVKAYMDLGQNDTVFESAIEGLREMTRTSLQVRSRLMTEIASGQRKPLTIPERSMQLAALVNVKGFAKDAEEARQIAQDTLREEIQLGLVKGY